MKRDIYAEEMKYEQQRLAALKRYDAILASVDDIPAADVRENDHARWKGQGFGYYMCSLCNSVYGYSNKFKFCPNCGAIMDIDDEDE